MKTYVLLSEVKHLIKKKICMRNHECQKHISVGDTLFVLDLKKHAIIFLGYTKYMSGRWMHDQNAVGDTASQTCTHQHGQ